MREADHSVAGIEEHLEIRLFALHRVSTFDGQQGADALATFCARGEQSIEVCAILDQEECAVGGLRVVVHLPGTIERAAKGSPPSGRRELGHSSDGECIQAGALIAFDVQTKRHDGREREDL